MARKFYPCSVPKLTAAQAVMAAQRAAEEAPHRHPTAITPAYLAVEKRCWWGDKGKTITVAFANGASEALKNRILEHANAWSEFANVRFEYSPTDPMVRISFGAGGYWSYLGTDILGIPANQPTMNLEAFTAKTSEAEYRRVVRHEFGHTLGFPHEHMRSQLVARLDRSKTIKYFRQTQGWSAAEVEQQVLTPLSESSIRGTPDADDTSIMCYQLPGSITKDGKPIKGGNDINPTDAAFIATIYPKPGPVAPPTPPAGEFAEFTIRGRRYRVVEVI
jgi:hypothetical protein